MLATSLLIAAFIAPFAALAVRYWQRALFSVFVLLIFEGALRKWAFPGAQAQIYFVKDAILLAAYLGYILDSRKIKGRLPGAQAISVFLIVGFIFGCIEVLNPNSPSILIGLMGIKVYFLYAPLAFIMPYAFNSREQLFRYIWCYLLIAIPVAILSFVQIAAGPGSFINTYVSYNEDTAAGTGFGTTYSLVRTSATFSYISGYTAFLSFIGFLAIGFNMAKGWRIRNNVIPLAALALTVGAMFTTGSRTPVYTLIATAPVVLLWAAAAKIVAPRIVVRLCILLPVLALVALNVSPQAVVAFSERVSDSDDSTSGRLLSGLDQLVEALRDAPIFGFGIGATHPSAMTIMATDSFWWLNGVLVESEPARVTVEIGFIGLLLMVGLRILISLFAIRCTRSFRDPAYRALGICLTIHLTLGIMGSIILNATAGIYYWGALGLMLTMQRFDQTQPLAVLKKKLKKSLLQTISVTN